MKIYLKLVNSLAFIAIGIAAISLVSAEKSYLFWPGAELGQHGALGLRILLGVMVLIFVWNSASLVRKIRSDKLGQKGS